MSRIEKYVKELEEFNTRPGGHEEYHADLAPHQPILLLGLIKLYEEDKIDLRDIDPNSKKLSETIKEIWKDWLGYEKKFEKDRHIAYPLYYLGNSQDFWKNELVAESDEPKNPNQVKTKVKRYIIDDNQLIQLLDNEESRNKLIKALMRSGNTFKTTGKYRYFSDEDKKMIKERMGLRG